MVRWKKRKLISYPVLFALVIVLSIVGVVVATGGDSYYSLFRIGGLQTSSEWVGRSGVEDSELVIGSSASVTVSITNSPNSFGFGYLVPNEISGTGLDYFTVGNSGNVTVDVTIQGTDMVGGTVTWTLSDDGSNGADIYGAKSGLSGGDYDVIVKRNSPYNALMSNLGLSDTQDWGLQFQAPTSGIGNESVSGTVTLTASEHTE